MPLKVFYNNKQSVSKNNSPSPSAGKPALIADLFLKTPNVELVSDFLPLTREELSLAHDPNYINEILNCERNNGFGNSSQEIADSLPWTNGSFFAAAEHAFLNKTVTMSPTSGFHHAGYEAPEGFCTFNGLMITAMLMKKKHNVKDICVIDFDAHYGNGTDEIKAKLDAKFVRNYTFGEFANRILRDSGSAGFDNWLNSLGALKLIDIVMDGCDVIFYQAGADPHVDDPYGGYLTTNQMILRDKIVFEAAKRNNIPIVWNLAGGYQSPVQKVLDLHQNTLVECLKVYGDSL